MAKNKKFNYNSLEKSENRTKVIFWVLVALFVVVLGVLGFFLWRQFRPAEVNKLPKNIEEYETEAVEEETIEEEIEEETEWYAPTNDTLLNEANHLAAQYDYDAAIARLEEADDYDRNETYQQAVENYESMKKSCVQWTSYDKITHIFFHSLVVDSDLAFNSYKRDDYNQVMTTVEEFNKILESMYERGYVLISLHNIARMETMEDGTEQMVKQEIYLPRGKKPFVLSQDDVCYYEYMTGTGFATKLCLDENGKVVNEYVNTDGSVSYGSYDVLTILEDFLEEHPDFSYKGSKGILAFTGYNGVLGYRTSDFWYKEGCDYYISNEKNDYQKTTEYSYPNPNIEQDKETAKQVAQAIRDLGWEMASHSWGHPSLKECTYERFTWDTDMWEKEVEPIIGDTDIILYPLGADVGEWWEYTSEKNSEDTSNRYQYLKAAGFDYFCNVDSSQYWVQITDQYFRQGRRNIDGQMIYKQIVQPDRDWTNDLFVAEDIIDPKRPIPVPGVVPSTTEAATTEGVQAAETAAGVTETAAGVTETAAGATETPSGVTETAAGATETPAGVTETAAGVTAASESAAATEAPVQP